MKIAPHGGLENEFVRKRRRSRFLDRFRRFGGDPVVSDGGFLRRANGLRGLTRFLEYRTIAVSFHPQHRIFDGVAF